MKPAPTLSHRPAGVLSFGGSIHRGLNRSRSLPGGHRLAMPPEGGTPTARRARFFAVLLLSLTFLPGSLAAQDWHEGLCQATVDASLSFPVPGVLAKIVKKEGETVKEGDVILEMESEMETLEVTRQKLAVASAKSEFDRTKKVFDKGGSVTAEDVEQKEAVWKIAIVEQQQAEAQLRRRQLVAPNGGVLVKLFDLDRGEAVAANAPAARVVDISQCRFTIYVRGNSPHGFEKGGAVEIFFKTPKEEVTVSGAVDFVSLAIDAASGLQEVRAVFDNMDGRVPAGLLGKMRLKPAR